jgi:hypothetical protein
VLATMDDQMKDNELTCLKGTEGWYGPSGCRMGLEEGVDLVSRSQTKRVRVFCLWRKLSQARTSAVTLFDITGLVTLGVYPIRALDTRLPCASCCHRGIQLLPRSSLIITPVPPRCRQSRRSPVSGPALYPFSVVAAAD